jgi:acyl carrier protein
MTEADIYTSLSVIFSDVLMRDDLVLTPELTAADVPGWDSYKHIEIIIYVQEQFNIKFTTAELDNFRMVGDLVLAIHKRIPN